jgi:hypothetical protein
MIQSTYTRGLKKTKPLSVFYILLFKDLFILDFWQTARYKKSVFYILLFMYLFILDFWQTARYKKSVFYILLFKYLFRGFSGT